jgi:hypothetical protein
MSSLDCWKLKDVEKDVAVINHDCHPRSASFAAYVSHSLKLDLQARRMENGGHEKGTTIKGAIDKKASLAMRCEVQSRRDQIQKQPRLDPAQHTTPEVSQG